VGLGVAQQIASAAASTGKLAPPSLPGFFIALDGKPQSRRRKERREIEAGTGATVQSPSADP
jgi:hypothetical protein